MKKILTLIIPTLLAGNLSTFALQTNNKTISDQLTWDLNINENKYLPNTGDIFSGLVAGHTFNYNFSAYAMNLNSFVSKYPYFTFSSDNYIKANIYLDHETHYLNQKYSTKSLIVEGAIYLDTITAVYKISSVESNVSLATQLETIDDSSFAFLILYTGKSNGLSTNPSYSVNINSLTFLTS